MEQDWSDIREIIQKYDVGEIEMKVDLLDRYAKMLRRRRDWGGLTSRMLPESIEGAMVESVAVLTAADRGDLDVVEIGSGGGLLGMTISIMCSSWQVTMVESSSRKSAFLAEVVGSLGLENAQIFAGRAEQIKEGGTFNLCLSRASGRLVDLAPSALRLLKPGGKYIALKSSVVASEVEEAREAIDGAGGNPAVVLKAADLPAVYAGRISLVVIERPRLS